MKIDRIGIVVISLLLIFIIWVSAWSMQPTEEVLRESVQIAEQEFNQESKVTNTNLEHFNIYLPEEFTVAEQSVSNVLLEKDNQTFILFYNTLEDSTSRLNYEAAVSMDNHLALESFEDEDRFGYINISNNQEDEIQLQVGIGGVKITTFTDWSDMKHDVSDMMKIANSLAYE
ncbi:hypothetical protein [Gracilibacillus sp. YIM 98692]|uniref:hypothetical protein n=1 Tax=Gracilibacillus sp. YIM 98692 TaxID=2663532 RepID=UPI0013D2F54B|nr:hypothetical protein [Gracilibacillus sp. YIM 98692]